MVIANTVSMDFHKGETILKLAATYPTLREVIEELVQNAIDSNATTIHVKLNWQSRNLTVRDNGNGVSQDNFTKALNSVGKSVKDRGKLGQFGLGLISPLGKCRKFTFTSCCAPNTIGYLEWAMDTEAIRSQSKDLHIPVRLRSDLTFGVNNSMWWRTEVAIYDFTTDRISTNMTIDELSQGIIDKYSPTMLRNKITVKLFFVDKDGTETEKKVKGRTFTGRQISDVTLDDEFGKTTFRMFIARKRDKKERVDIRFGEANNEFRFTFANFAKSSARQDLSQDTINALGSGIFEGEILTHTATLLPNRNNFVKNDKLVGLCLHIEEWYDQYGKQHLNQAKKERQEERYQNLAIKSLRNLDDLLRSSDSNLREMIRTMFTSGTIGNGHVSKKGELQDINSVSVNGHSHEKEAKDSKDKPSVKERKQQRRQQRERPAHIPMVVQGPRGNQRRAVSHNSIGLHLVHDDLGGSADLWRLDREQGLLTFNITHPLWVECDKLDSSVCALQEYIIMNALILETMPDKDVATLHQRLFSDELMRIYVPWLAGGAGKHSAANQARRSTIRGRPRKKKIEAGENE